MERRGKVDTFSHFEEGSGWWGSVDGWGLESAFEISVEADNNSLLHHLLHSWDYMYKAM